MLREKCFTLIELMVIIIIVSILAAVSIPVMRGRIDATKWSEGRVMAWVVGMALRSYSEEHGDSTGLGAVTPSGLLSGTADALLGFTPGDMNGKYFKEEDFSISGYVYNPANDPPLKFLITVTAADLTPPLRTLDHLGEWKTE